MVGRGTGADGASASGEEPAINARAIGGNRKTSADRFAAGGYKLPRATCYISGEDQQAINEEK